jgi:type II secretory ATPase GspE/PulE/Tfp pilus assembly ATPase PilB-like protein
MDKNQRPQKSPTDTPSLDRVVSNLQRQKEEELTQKSAAGLSLPYRNMNGIQPNPVAVGLIPKAVAMSGRIFAFEKSGQKVDLAIVNPEDADTLASLKTLEAMDEYDFQPIIVSNSSMDYLLALYDTFSPEKIDHQHIEIDLALKEQFSSIANLKQLQQHLATTSISELMEIMLAGATALGASDIHIEPAPDGVRLRYRLDGVLQDIAILATDILKGLIDRIKVISKLKLNIKEAAQDGRFSFASGDTKYDIRVSILPTQYGESAVLRLLPQEAEFVSLDELGLSEHNRALVDEAIRLPNGLILNTGPTGSGKTTTLYAILNTVNSPTTKIITIEDPIEYRLSGITQTQVNEEENYSFATALKAIVRQDPDVILVGEIRDSETADIAINASLTGHLVFSTLHTNDAPGAIPRLIELRANPALFADALRLIIAQRLVRKLCPQCATSAAPTPEETATIKSLYPQAVLPEALAHPTGCDACNGTGYKGRIGVFEIAKVTPTLKAAIAKSANAAELRALTISEGMMSLAQDGLAKVDAKITSLEELVRVVGETGEA